MDEHCTRSNMTTDPSKHASWDSHVKRCLWKTFSAHLFHARLDDLLLQSRCWEGLHDCPGRLGGAFHFLAKDVPNACFCRGLHASLETAQPLDAEDASLLHLLRCDLQERLEQLRAGLLLQAMLFC